MWVYLNKKVSIPNGLKLNHISWNGYHGWIACGGENGLLKVLKLETKADINQRGVTAPTSLEFNQTLAGHSGKESKDQLPSNVMRVSWNEENEKLTSSDASGLIIVWNYNKQKKEWEEEMLNNREKSVVKDLKWSSDGQKICIVYDDGAVIVGGVDGNRNWGKSLKTQLVNVEWSPDARYLLFGTGNGEVWLFDANSGIKLVNMNPQSNNILAGVDWYDGREGYPDLNAPTLAICYRNGRCQLMRGDLDDDPVLIDAGMLINEPKWNPSGTVLALAGQQDLDGKPMGIIQFYSPYGKHLKTLKVPGNGVKSVTWEGSGLRLALGVDANIFFANVRPSYRWGYFSKTVVYAFTKLERPEQCVVFYNHKTRQKYVKYIKKLLALSACGENCVLLTKTETPKEAFVIIICNSIGSPVETKSQSVEPKFVTMTKYHVIVCSDCNVYVWNYRAKQNTQGNILNIKGESEQYLMHIDQNKFKKIEDETKLELTTTEDAICAVFSNEKFLIIARESGTVNIYSLLPTLAYLGSCSVMCRPLQIAINCDCTKLSLIDINSTFTVYSLSSVVAAQQMVQSEKKKKKGNIMADKTDLEKKDVWDMRWADDNPSLFAIMEKTKMYTFRDLTPEEPVVTSAYMCAFNNLKIKSVFMDDIMANPDNPDSDCAITYESRSLRDTKEIIRSVSLRDANEFVKDNPHPRLWRLLAEAAMSELELDMAYKAYIQCGDYHGVYFVKQIKQLDNEAKQKAEIEAYFHRLDEAEKIYRSIDRKDLAIDLRKRYGDWKKVLSLVREMNGSDEMLIDVFNHLGDFYSERQQWERSIQFYVKARNFEKLIEAYYRIGDFESLERMVDDLPENNPLLHPIGEKLASVGLSTQAIQALVKGGKIKQAIDVCVELNQWDEAVTLAEKHNMSEIEDILYKYANHLVSRGDMTAAIELYQKANRNTESAKILAKLGEEEGKMKLHPLRAKKFYVLSALEIDRYRARLLNDQATRMNPNKALQTMLSHDASTNFENPWRGAEAYHFFLLAQKQLTEFKLSDCLNTTMRLVSSYEEYFVPKELYSLLALAGFYAREFKVCSKAFIKLESMDALSEHDKEKYEQLAIDIFRDSPVNSTDLETKPCPTCSNETFDYEQSCASCNAPFYTCIVSGRNIGDQDFWTCSTCKHRAVEHEIYKYRHCPLCHTNITEGSSSELF
ncbi:hypothetical protein NAEGRDRAFT_32701 [Naegleria gruberi]|uniref:Anaphase-promoting complex subunit 4 WD40 domain-containing protein n=1 Tax=Naegleria gruberi TaxID=5762 RepID=D2VBD3_NAEGR|nr:uncharacterized protein NAEGRDRAFT_32701 [Naegleria gruberi]EFC45890.1 hypothetical protein NAEGRDRAFT_32701 [Naegleria gruberi]|eukprot:XP_002678634.1 hypothetical protein NAEGRDRAFT_32701 [Naegleria gruberi strain NEG-M]